MINCGRMPVEFCGKKTFCSVEISFGGCIKRKANTFHAVIEIHLAGGATWKKNEHNVE